MLDAGKLSNSRSANPSLRTKCEHSRFAPQWVKGWMRPRSRSEPNGSWLEALCIALVAFMADSEDLRRFEACERYETHARCVKPLPAIWPKAPQCLPPS